MNSADYHAFTTELLAAVENDPAVLGLIAVGSMSEVETQPDAWSDHDFFLVVKGGEQERFRMNPGWLPRHSEIVYSFRETEHGLKVIYSDGHLAEFAVFDPIELQQAGINRYRILLNRAGLESVLPGIAARKQSPPSDSYLAGQFLSNSLVAGGRWHRGELLSARMFLVAHAVPQLVRLVLRHIPPENAAPPQDNFDPLRRLEFRYPVLAGELNAALERPFLECAGRLLEFAGSRLPQIFPADAIVAVRKLL